MLEAAMKAQRRGLRIFPVRAGAKTPHPAVPSWPEGATNDPGAIEHFWSRVDPMANIGVACKPSELLVIDLDLAKEDWNLMGTPWAYLHEGYGPRVGGEAVFDEVMFHSGDRPYNRALETYAVRTGSGGLHLYYRWPAHWPRASQASPVKGVVDVRCNGGQHGGYVLAEGSRTDAGWYQPADAYGREPLVAPEWLRRLVADRPPLPSPRKTGIRQPGAVSWSGLAETVRSAQPGNRNNSLLWAARSMCSDGASAAEALDVLGEAATVAGLGATEIERTVASAYRIQQQKEGA